MTVFQLYKQAASFLEEKEIENFEAEARFLTEKACGIAHETYLLERNRTVLEREKKAALSLCEKRASGIPLQYLLEKWEFMSLDFYVGQGVLIPRPETEQLCEYVIEKAKNMKNPVIFDLCSGSGCIGLSLKHTIADAEVYLIEKSDQALRYLEKNRIALGFGSNTVLIKGDILKGFDGFSFLPKPDIIVSNPPYIKTCEIPLLQKEVLFEPSLALDGGEDGLLFYRALADLWLPHIKDGGFIAVECGEEQASDISALFLENCPQTEIVKDFNNINRIVAGFIQATERTENVI